MTHAQLFSLIAQVTKWHAKADVKECFDALDPVNCKVAYVGDNTLVLDGHQIAVLAIDGSETIFDLGEALVIGG